MNQAMHAANVEGDAFGERAPEPEELVLAGEFPAPGREEWVALVDQVVGKAGRLPADAAPGAGFERLSWTT